MAAYIVNIRRVADGSHQQLSTGVIGKEATTEALINAQLAAKPDNVSIVMDVASEAQVRALCHYARAIDIGTDTSSVETAISAII